MVQDACGMRDEGIVGGDEVSMECDSDKGEARGNEVSMNEVRRGEPAGTAGRGLKEGLLTNEFLLLAVSLGISLSEIDIEMSGL